MITATFLTLIAYLNSTIFYGRVLKEFFSNRVPMNLRIQCKHVKVLKETKFI